jgi:hypothetical protein
MFGASVPISSVPVTPRRAPERILGVDSMEMEKEGVDVELRRPVGIGGDLWRLP